MIEKIDAKLPEYEQPELLAIQYGDVVFAQGGGSNEPDGEEVDQEEEINE